MPDGAFRHIVRTKDVVLDRLLGCILHQRNVLVGSGMDDDLRAHLSKDTVQRVHIPDGTNPQLQRIAHHLAIAVVEF